MSVHAPNNRLTARGRLTQAGHQAHPPCHELSTGRVHLRGLTFHAPCGASEAEQKVGCRCQVDASVELDLSRAIDSDNILDTVDYGRLVSNVLQIGSRPRNLLESMAGEIALSVLAEFAQVSSVTVRVEKLHPPLPASVAGAAVEINMTRSSE